MKRRSIINLLKASAFGIIALLGMRALFMAHTPPINGQEDSTSRRRGIPQLTWILVIVVVGLIVIWTMPTTSSATQIVVTVDSTGDVGINTSIALDSGSIPVIAYYDNTNADLKLARCNNSTTCSTPTNVTIDPNNQPGVGGISLALSATNAPIIAYIEASNHDLRLAFCDSPTCGHINIYTIDDSGLIDSLSSLRLTSTGIPVIAYDEAVSQELKLATCNSSSACDNPTLVTVDSALTSASWISLQLDSSGVALMSYFALPDNDLHFAHCNTLSCSAPTLRTLDGNIGSGYSSSMQLRSGIPVIVYDENTQNAIKLYTCDDATCATGTIEPLALGSTSIPLAFALDTSGYPVIVQRVNGDLGLGRCFTQHCANPINTLPDSGTANVGSYPSLALAGTFPVISYYDETNGDLKLYNSRNNSAPVLVNNKGATLSIGTSTVLNNSKLLFSDADNSPAASLIYTVITTPTQGNLSLTTFTQAQVGSNAVTYTHTGAVGGDSFSYTVTDGVTLVGPFTFNFTILAQTLTPTITFVPSTTPVPSHTATPFISPTPTVPTATRTVPPATLTALANTLTAAASITPSVTNTRGPTSSPFPTFTPSVTRTPAPATMTPTPSLTPLPSNTILPSNTPLPTLTPSPLPTGTPFSTFTSSPLPSTTPLPTDTPFSTFTSSPLPTDTPFSTFTSSPLPTSTPFSTFTSSPAASATATTIPPTAPDTFTPLPSATPTASATFLSTVTPTGSPTVTQTPTATNPTATRTPIIFGGTVTLTTTNTPAFQTTTITENEFFEAVVSARQGYPDIITIVPDFVPNAINMTMAVSGGMIGNVSVDVTQEEDFVTFDITSITVNGTPAPNSFVTIINRDLPEILTAALDSVLTTRFGSDFNVHTLTITGDSIIVTLN